MKGEGTPQLPGHCTLQKTWFKWLAITLYVLGWWLQWTFSYLGITLHVEDGQRWQHRVESVAVSGIVLWTDLNLLLSVSMWTRITRALAVYILTFLLVHCICSVLMCLQWLFYVELEGYIGCCVRENVTWVFAVLKLHKHHTLALTLWLSPRREHENQIVEMCFCPVARKRRKNTFLRWVQLELYLLDLRHIMFH